MARRDRGCARDDQCNTHVTQTCHAFHESRSLLVLAPSMDQQIWQWTLTKEAIAPCFVRDVLAMRQHANGGRSLDALLGTCSPDQMTTFSGSDTHLVARLSSSAWSSEYKSTISVLFTLVSLIHVHHSLSVEIITSRRWHGCDQLYTSSPSAGNSTFTPTIQRRS